MRMPPIITAFLVAASTCLAGDFASLVGKDRSAADAWLGKPFGESPGSRDYRSGDYTFTLWFSGDALTKITIPYFPETKTPKAPAEVAAMIEPVAKVRQGKKVGALEHYDVTDSKGRIWTMILTPGTSGYSVANILVPTN